jgi:hypothetical protein
MKRFDGITMKFVLALKNASKETDIVNDQTICSLYDEFADAVLAEEPPYHQDMRLYRKALVYTRAKLAGLTQVLKKKCNGLPLCSH